MLRATIFAGLHQVRSQVAARRTGAALRRAAATETLLERSPLDALGDSAPSWGQLQAAHVTLVAASVGQPGSGGARARALAASRLSPETAMDVMDSVEVLSVFVSPRLPVVTLDAHWALGSRMHLMGNWPSARSSATLTCDSCATRF
jgi:hypothetical protein